MTTNRNTALQKMKKASTGSYDKVKDAEARAGGRALPAGLENELGVVTNCKIDLTEKGGDPYLYIYAAAKTPEEYAGVQFGFIYTFADSQYTSYDAAMGQFVNDMKLLGFDTEQFGDEMELVQHVETTLKNERRQFLYNTSHRRNKNGEFRAFIAGLPDVLMEDNEAPERSPMKKKGKPKATSPFAVGDSVETTGDYYEDGNTYRGVVEEIGNGVATVRFDDDNAVDEIPFGNLIKSTAAAESESSEFEEGDAVDTVGDFFETGEEYRGTVLSVDEESCSVEFEDGTYDVPFENLRLVV